MNLMFWRKKKASASGSEEKIKRRGKPRDLPQEVGRYLVVVQGLDPDWVWSLKCVRKVDENTDSIFNIRIFSPETVAQHNVVISNYDSLDHHMNLVLFAGWYEAGTRHIQLEQTVKEAV